MPDRLHIPAHEVRSLLQAATEFVTAYYAADAGPNDFRIAEALEALRPER